MRRYDLIIFDCDGTLVDSETLNNRMTSETLTRLGLPQCDLAYCLNHFAGLNLVTILANIKRDFGVVITPDMFLSTDKTMTDTSPGSQLQAAPDALECVTLIAAQIPVCVASNGRRPVVLRSLLTTGFSQLLPEPITFTADMVTNPKPAPDLFLHAAKIMGAVPERCLVVEDSVTGCRAGLAAGMTVIGYTGVHHTKLAQADVLRDLGVPIIVDGWRDILGHILPESAGQAARS